MKNKVRVLITVVLKKFFVIKFIEILLFQNQ